MYANGKSKAAAIIGYLTWIGCTVAFIIRDRDDALSRHHLNQALVLNIFASVASILRRIGGLPGIIGEAVDIGVLVMAVFGIVRAVKGSDEPLPFLGDIKLY